MLCTLQDKKWICNRPILLIYISVNISEMTVQLSYSPIQFYQNQYIYFTEWLYFYYSFVSYLTSASKAVLHETSSNAVKLDKPNYV